MVHTSTHSFKYDEAERRKRQNPELLLAMIGLKPKMCFIDIGCNNGFFTLPAARMVGASGKVIAIDIDQESLDDLKSKLKLENLNNTTVIAAKAEDSIPYHNEADIIFLGTVLHDFQDPLKVFVNAKQMLKSGGIIFNLDWKPIITDYGPPLAKRFTIEHVAELGLSAGLKMISAQDIDQNYYLTALSL